MKRLWLDALETYPTAVILRAAQHAIERSDYLPTLNRMIEACRHCLSDLGLPSPYDAYREACLAPSPKNGAPWSHAAVYLAGRDSDWFFLANQPENKSWPIYREHYERWVSRAAKGEVLEGPERAPASHPLMTARLAQRSNPPIWRGCEEKSGCKRFANQPAVDHASMASRTLWA